MVFDPVNSRMIMFGGQTYPGPDSDADCVADVIDNCPTVANPDQADGDADGVGDACDLCSDTPPGGRVGASGCAPMDFNHDGDVDLGDFGQFQVCFNGPNRPPGDNCMVDGDVDGDGDVDLNDFGAFQACFNGPNRPPACTG
jgi:hypothetical protein